MTLRLSRIFFPLVSFIALGCSGAEPELDGAASFGQSSQAVTATSDSLQDYAIACEAATGIRVPGFNCADGVDVPQGTAISSLPDASRAFALVNTRIGVGSGTVTGLIQNAFAVETIVAGGTDISGTSDQFVFANVKKSSDGTLGLTGDGYVETYVTELGNTNAWAKAGLMFRDGAAANARNVMVAITPSSGVTFQHRLTPGATTTNAATLSGWAAPAWLRLVRKGNTFTGFATKDRVRWTQVGSPVTFASMSAQPLVGIAVTSHNSSQQTTAKTLQFAWTPDTPFQSCDRPMAMRANHQEGPRCDPGSRFLVLAQNPDAAVVAICRQRSAGLDDSFDNDFAEVAVIQYNKQNGAQCFYSSSPSDRTLGLDGSRVPAPTSTATSVPASASLAWSSPSVNVDCVRCHDNGGFIRSPYLTQLASLPPSSVAFTLPSTPQGYANLNSPLRFVGHDFTNVKTWSVEANQHESDEGPSCTGCHKLAVNNVHPNFGTAAEFSEMSTGSQMFKNADGPTSPIWMRPGQVVFDEGASLTAANIAACMFNVDHEDTDECTFDELGKRWDYTDRSFSDWAIGGTGAAAYHGGQYTDIITMPSDITGTSDRLMYSETFVPSGEDGTATVQVTGFLFGESDAHPLTKAGLMLRAGLGAGDPYVMVGVTPTGPVFQYRTSVGGGTTGHAVSGSAWGAWLKLVRTGSTFTGWTSSDLATWQQIGPAITIPALRQANMAGPAASSPQANTWVGFKHFAWTPSTPATLRDANVGVSGGSRKQFEHTNTITAGGAGISGTSDQFHYSFRSLDGDGEITARVTALGNTNGSAKAGLMFRSTGAANSPHAMIAITPSSGATFVTRSTAGGSTSSASTSGRAVPLWLRLRRSGNTFTGFTSTDGLTFTQVGSAKTISGFNASALVGLAVSSHNTGTKTTATFTNLQLPGKVVACTYPIHETWADALEANSTPTESGWKLLFGDPATDVAANPLRSRLRLSFDDIVENKAPLSGSFYVSHEVEVSGGTVFTPYPLTDGVLLPSLRRSGNDIQLGGARYGWGNPWSDVEPAGFAGKRLTGTLKAVVTTFVKAQEKRVAVKVEANGVVHRSGWTAQLSSPVTDLTRFRLVGENNSAGPSSPEGDDYVFVGPLGGCSSLTDSEVDALYNK